MQMFYYSDKGVLVINVKLFISSSCINYLLQGRMVCTKFDIYVIITSRNNKEIIHGSHGLYPVLTWVTLFSQIIYHER